MIGRIRHLTPSMVDAALAVVLAVLAEFELFFVGLTPHEAIANAITLPFMTLPLALRRRAPTVGLLVIVTAGRLQPLVGGTFRNGGTVPILVLLLAMYSVAAGKDARGALVGGGLAVAVLVTTPPVTPGDLIYRLVLVTVPWVLGRVVRDRQERAEGLEVRAKGIHLEQDAKIEAATTEERARIARELHDIVAHSVGVMVIQASGAQKVLDKRPQRAREALQSIELTGRQALDELHRVLGILRTDSDGESLTPQPSLRNLDTLLEQIRQGGLPVEATIEGDVRPLPPGIELAAYRIVQEALTNSLKHAGKVKADVRIRYREHDLQLEVSDDGKAAAVAVTNTSGHGLVGMRERVGLYGGSLTVGRVPEGGYSVRATLPLDG
jgi:signal transduction histidine kinase